MIDGLTRWKRYSDGRVETEECDARFEMASESEFLEIITDRHFNSRQIRSFLEFLTLEPMGRARAADRDCVSVKALPRPGDGLWPHWLPYRADEYELHVDLERGVLLNIIGCYQGDFLGQHEVTEVVFDEPLDHNLFTYEPAPGDQVQPKARLDEELSHEEAISRMPFQVLFPTLMHKPDYRLSTIQYHRPRCAGNRPFLSLAYDSPAGYLAVWVCEDAEPDVELDDYEWERLTYDGIAQKDIRISDSGKAEDERIVAFEQSGTYVTMYSGLDSTRLIEIALSFKAATDNETRWPDDGRGGSHCYPF